MQTHIAKPGECLCSIARSNSFGFFADCSKLRDANPDLKDSETLKGGEVVKIPALDLDAGDAPTQSTTVFVSMVPPPEIKIIREEGKGYGVGTTSSTGPLDALLKLLGMDVKPQNQPSLDPEAVQIGLTNYVCDRGGDGTVVANFPADSLFNFDKNGSDDPDHFKIQLEDSNNDLGVSASSAKINLYAMKPSYQKATSGSGPGAVTRVELVPGGFTKPSSADRKLMDVECKRVPGTLFFRSPYMRLVSTKGQQSKRPKQCLMVSDYFDEGPKTHEKLYTEIVDQQVMAEYKIPGCPVNKCAINRSVPVAAAPIDMALHLAFWAFSGTGVTLADARKAAYSFCRRIFACTGLRVNLESFNVVDEPKNMISIAGSPPAFGFLASATNSTGTQSKMVFKIDAKSVEYRPVAGDTPVQTANKIVAAVTADARFAGYTLSVFPVPNKTPGAAAAGMVDGADIIVFKPDGKAAITSGGGSSEVFKLAGGVILGGQTLRTDTGFSLNGFPVDFDPRPPSRAQRVVRWNFKTPDAMNIYVLGSPLVFGTGNFDGWSPLGPFAGYVADVGPCVYLANTGISRPSVVAHEVCHPGMHMFHTRAPLNDSPPAPGAGPRTVELMEAGVLQDSDGHDVANHIADAPIKAVYDLQEAMNSSVDGVSLLANGAAGTTPVLRLFQVGLTHGVIRLAERHILAADVTDCPEPKPASPAGP